MKRSNLRKNTRRSRTKARRRKRNVKTERKRYMVVTVFTIQQKIFDNIFLCKLFSFWVWDEVISDDMNISPFCRSPRRSRKQRKPLAPPPIF